MNKTVLVVLLVGILFSSSFSFSSVSMSLVRNRSVSYSRVLSDAGGEWNHTFGGPYNDYGNCVQQTGDGGYIIAGERSFDRYGEDAAAWIIKTDNQGNKIWERLFGSRREYVHYVDDTSDGGFKSRYWRIGTSL